MKKNILIAIAVVISVVLLAPLGALVYVVYDQAKDYVASTKVSEPLTEKIFDDGTKETYTYNENGDLTERIRYGANGEMLTRYAVIYENGAVAFEKQYNAAGKLEVENAYTAESVATTVYIYDENNKLINGEKRVVSLTEDETYEEHDINSYGGIIESRYYDANGALLLTRVHHITPAGYRDGYTETDKDGKAVRYNSDGTVRK